MIKKIITLSIIVIGLFALSNADEPWFEIIPWATNSNVWQMVDNINEGGKVWENYKNTAYWTETTSNNKRVRPWSNLSLWDQFASGIMTWDTILDYAVYLVKFLWQLALLSWSLMLIYYGYKKATEHLKFNNGAVWKIVIGILVITFAYVIVKIIWSMFIS